MPSPRRIPATATPISAKASTRRSRSPASSSPRSSRFWPSSSWAGWKRPKRRASSPPPTGCTRWPAASRQSSRRRPRRCCRSTKRRSPPTSRPGLRKPLPRSADRTLPERPFRLAGGAAVAVAVAALIGTLFWTILSAAAAQPPRTAHADVGYLIYISTLQAALSTVFSLIAGVALAWALDRLRFHGRRLLIALFAAAIVTPGLVVAFGLLTVWGRSGWLGGLNVPIFGLGGVVAAHVILDGAFATRILVARLDAIPERRLKTGQSLALSPWTRFAVIDWPAIRG